MKDRDSFEQFLQIYNPNESEKRTTVFHIMHRHVAFETLEFNGSNLFETTEQMKVSALTLLGRWRLNLSINANVCLTALVTKEIELIYKVHFVK